jgi:glycosylphosphatidylinositol transamidase (GPIT) subunit GPI8
MEKTTYTINVCVVCNSMVSESAVRAHAFIHICNMLLGKIGYQVTQSLPVKIEA